MCISTHAHVCTWMWIHMRTRTLSQSQTLRYMARERERERPIKRGILAHMHTHAHAYHRLSFYISFALSNFPMSQCYSEVHTLTYTHTHTNICTAVEIFTIEKYRYIAFFFVPILVVVCQIMNIFIMLWNNAVFDRISMFIIREKNRKFMLTPNFSIPTICVRSSHPSMSCLGCLSCSRALPLTLVQQFIFVRILIQIHIYEDRKIDKTDPVKRCKFVQQDANNFDGSFSFLNYTSFNIFHKE